MRTAENQKTKRDRDVISGLRRELAFKKILYQRSRKDYFERLNAESQIEIQRFNYELGRLNTLEKLLKEIPGDSDEE